MITHDFKLFFVHIPKCAGRSVCDIFNQRFDHYTADYLNYEYGQFWPNYRKFSIVRNPYDRLVSLYVYLKNHRRHSKERIMVSETAPSFYQWLKMNIDNYQGDFSAGSAEGLRGTDGDLGSSFWFSSQFRRLQDLHTGTGKSLVADIFKLEEGMEKVEKYLAGITGIHAMMPHSNRSEYDNYRSFYTPEAIDIASKFPPIIQDCAAFNYSF